MFGLQFMNEIENMQREIDQLFHGFGIGGDYGTLARQPDFNVTDLGDSFRVEALLPGLDPEKLDINVLDRRLTVAGEFSQPELPQEVRWHRRERHGGAFERTLQFTTELDADKIEAEYKLGVLTISLPKAASALPKKISVNVS